jgi:hypothetical protein
LRSRGSEQRIAVQQVEIAGELFDAVDLASSLDLDGDAQPAGVTGRAGRQADRRPAFMNGAARSMSS